MSHELPTLYQQSKVCPSCKETLPLDQFYKNKRYRLGVGSYCKPCMKAYGMEHDGTHREQRALIRRRHLLKREYSMTIEEYDELFAKQEGSCAICKRQPEVRRLAVDHDHQTGRVRGLLCDNCNQALGKFRDDPELLLSAIRYLND